MGVHGMSMKEHLTIFTMVRHGGRLGFDSPLRLSIRFKLLWLTDTVLSLVAGSALSDDTAGSVRNSGGVGYNTASELAS